MSLLSATPLVACCRSDWVGDEGEESDEDNGKSLAGSGRGGVGEVRRIPGGTGTRRHV